VSGGGGSNRSLAAWRGRTNDKGRGFVAVHSEFGMRAVGERLLTASSNLLGANR
jgi:hypothetical protein